MAKRYRSKVGRSRKEYYVVRNALGQVIDVQSVSRATQRDAATAAKHKPKHRRHGYQGDY